MREELQEREDWHAELQQQRQAEFRVLRQRQLRDHNLDDSIAIVCSTHPGHLLIGAARIRFDAGGHGRTLRPRGGPPRDH